MHRKHLGRQTVVSTTARHQPTAYRSGLMLVLLAFLICLVGATRAAALKAGGVITPSSPGEIGPIGPQYESVVNVVQDFTIPDRDTTHVSLRWWNKGAPYTRLDRSIN